MGHSVTSILQNNIAGIPLIGSDICGFKGDATPELCARWYTLGAFYTLSRNHNSRDAKPQEPYLFVNEIYEGTVSVLDIIQRAMWTKYSFVQYMYSCLMSVNQFDGGTVHRPLYFEFDNDPKAYTASHQLNFMLGASVKISINSNQLDRNMTEFYFP